MRIAVLVKYVPDTEEPRRLDPATGVLDRSDGVLDEISSRALSWALRLRESEGGGVVVLTMGPHDASEALRAALAIGADEAVHVTDEVLTGADVVQTARVLAAALRTVGFDLVVAGAESTDGAAGAVPAMIAELLGVPHMTQVGEARVSDRTVTAVRETGDDSVELVAELPAVLSVLEKIDEPRVPGFRGIMGAKRKPRRTVGVADLGLDPTGFGGERGAWSISSVIPRPPREKGTIVADDGTAAAQIADFIVRRHPAGR